MTLHSVKVPAYSGCGRGKWYFAVGNADDWTRTVKPVDGCRIRSVSRCSKYEEKRGRLKLSGSMTSARRVASAGSRHGLTHATPTLCDACAR